MELPDTIFLGGWSVRLCFLIEIKIHTLNAMKTQRKYSGKWLFYSVRVQFTHKLNAKIGGFYGEIVLNLCNARDEPLQRMRRI